MNRAAISAHSSPAAQDLRPDASRLRLGPPMSACLAGEDEFRSSGREQRMSFRVVVQKTASRTSQIEAVAPVTTNAALPAVGFQMSQADQRRRDDAPRHPPRRS